MMVRVYRNTLHNESQGGSCIFFCFCWCVLWKCELEFNFLWVESCFSVQLHTYVVPDSGKLVSWECLLLLRPWKPVYPFASSLPGLHIIFSDDDLFCCSKIGHLKISRLGQTIDSFWNKIPDVYSASERKFVLHGQFWNEICKWRFCSTNIWVSRLWNCSCSFILSALKLHGETCGGWISFYWLIR